jgi:polysaccharide biosynthesis protein PslH
MRSLVVTHNTPWPAVGGGLIRQAQVVQALASVSNVDLLAVLDRRRSDFVVPSSVSVMRSNGVHYPRTSSQVRWRVAWAVRRGLPLEVVMARDDPGPRRALQAWAQPPYDVVWFATPELFEWMGRPSLGPTVVDFMDLENVKAQLRAELLAEQFRSQRFARAWRTRLSWYQTRLNGYDWRRFQRSVSAHVQQIAVPSELDAVRSGLPNVSVVPNSYPRPARPVGSPASSAAPVVLLQGSLQYAPNIDGAEWLARAIAPRIRAEVPATQVRLVGRPATSVTELHQPGVLTVVGEVPSMEEELAGAAVVVVPVRFGGGTRVKILESFAHRVPVVSTRLGAEGLDVEDGVHLLLADDAEQFAAAVVRLLRDAELRRRLVEAAEAHYLDRYDGRAADDAVRRLVERVTGVSTRS